MILELNNYLTGDQRRLRLAFAYAQTRRMCDIKYINGHATKLTKKGIECISDHRVSLSLFRVATVQHKISSHYFRNPAAY